MINPVPEKYSVMKAAVIHQDGKIKIRVTKELNTPRVEGPPTETKWQPDKPRFSEIRAPAAAARQPAPTTPGVTKQMVRQHLSKLVKDRLLEHNPKTTSEWLLAEWHLAREFNFPRLRLAHLVSETLHVSSGTEPRLQRACFE